MKKFILAVFVSLILAFPVYAYHDTVTKDGAFDYKLFLLEIYDFIKDNHVDSPEEQTLVEEAARGMLNAVDIHSQYFTKEEFKEFKNQSEGVFFGIGSQVRWDKEKRAVILELIFDGSPALTAGLKNGDIVIAINGEETYKINNFNKSIKKLKGPEGTIVELTILRNEEVLNETIKVTRGKITTPIVFGQVLDKSIPYIRLSQFSSKALNAVSFKLIEMVENITPTGFILDLRSNPGGRLDQAVGIVDMFVDDGLIVETKSRYKQRNLQYYASENVTLTSNVPIIVLINKYSASASEVVSGALQALGRATIIGEKSYGKGSVQTIMPLAHGGALKLTMAKYYTASQRVIHGVGITPDIEASLPKDYRRKDLNEVDSVMKTAVKLIKEINK